MTQTIDTDLPPGWRLDVFRDHLRLGWCVDSYFDAGSDRPITRSWATTRDRAVRFAHVIVAETDSLPKEVWL